MSCPDRKVDCAWGASFGHCGCKVACGALAIRLSVIEHGCFWPPGSPEIFRVREGSRPLYPPVTPVNRGWSNAQWHTAFGVSHICCESGAPLLPCPPHLLTQ